MVVWQFSRSFINDSGILGRCCLCVYLYGTPFVKLARPLKSGTKIILSSALKPSRIDSSKTFLHAKCIQKDTMSM